MKQLLISFLLALQNIRSNFLHTLLSILGIVIGVASLVAILSLIDGMEEYAHDTISKTTSLESIIISSKEYEIVDGIRMSRDTVVNLDVKLFQVFRNETNDYAEAYMSAYFAERIKTENDTIGIYFAGTLENIMYGVQIIEGRLFTKEEVERKQNLAVINNHLAEALDSTSSVLEKKITIGETSYKVIGIAESGSEKPFVAVPITTLTPQQLSQTPPRAQLQAKNVELVPEVKQKTQNWLDNEYFGGKEGFDVITNEFRVEQANQGFLVFRIIMGMIVGISVLVGGIGVMNVLLISVNERTPEIGVRKAAGAKKRDIMMQFLCESVTVSAFGSFLGLILGILGTMGLVPIVKAIAQVPFQASYTFNTLLVISIVALLIGIIFGTYPAMRAARLDPVEAIRRE